MKEKRKECTRKRGKELLKAASALLMAVAITAALPGVAEAGQTQKQKIQKTGDNQEKMTQIRGLNVLGASKTAASAAADLPTTLTDTDPMYWMGQRNGGDTNRAMVWFGEYWQKNVTEKSPLLWRTLRSDGKGNYGGAVTLLSEYVLNSSCFDKTGGEIATHWCNSNTSVGSSDVRAWMNGVGTGAMDSSADLPSRLNDMAYNTKGGGAGDPKGSFYANAFKDEEKSLIIPTLIEKENGSAGTAGKDVADKIFALSGKADSGSLDAFNELYFDSDADRLGFTTNGFGVSAPGLHGSPLYNQPSSTLWWLRTPNDTVSEFVYNVGAGGDAGYKQNRQSDIGLRPALNFDGIKVMFVPADEEGGAAVVNEQLTACNDARLTSFETTLSGGFRVFRRESTSASQSLQLMGNPGADSAYVKISSCTPNDFISVLAVNKTTGKKWCGRIGVVPDTGSGTLKFMLPDTVKVPPAGSASSDYRLFAWTEDEAAKTAGSGITEADIHELDPLLSIVYDANGGTGSMEESFADNALKASFSDNGFLRTGYAFKEWNTNEDGNGDTYHAGDEVTLDAASGGLKVYAAWEKEKNNLTLNPAGGTIPAGGFGNTDETNDPVTRSDLEFETSLSLPDPVREGYTFAGWSTDTTLIYAGSGTDPDTSEPNPDRVLAQAGGQFTSSEVTSMPAAGKTGGTVILTAQWKKNITAVSDTDPMYWVGRAGSSDNERAMVWFGKNEQSTAGVRSPVLWRALDSSGMGNYEGRLTLITEFIQQSVVFNEADAKNQKWSESTLRTWMNGTGSTYAGRPDFLSGFTNQEQELILNEYHDARNYSADDSVKKNYGSAEKVFAPDYNDAVSAKYFSVSGEGADESRKAFNTALAASKPIFGNALAPGAAGWWLRSPDSAPGTEGGSAGSVEADGSISYSTGDTVLGARPAVNMDSSKIIFTTASNEGGKPDILKDEAASAAAGTFVSRLYETASDSPSDFSPAYPSAADYSAGKTGYRIFTRTGKASPLKLYYKEGTARIEYENLSEGEYIHVMLVQTSNKKKWTGRVKEIKAGDIPAPSNKGRASAGAAGSVSFTLPDSIVNDEDADLSGYRLFAWTEREGAGDDLGTADEPVTNTLNKLFDGLPPIITVDSGTVADKANVGKWTNEAKVQIDFAPGWSDREKGEVTIQYKLGSDGTWTDYTYDLTDPKKSEVITIGEEGNTTIYSRCVLKDGGAVTEVTGTSYKIIRVDTSAPDISGFKKKTTQDAQDGGSTKLKLTFRASDKPTSAAGSTPTKEEQYEGVDGIYNSGIKDVYYTEVDLEELMNEKADAGLKLTLEDLENLSDERKAEKLTPLKNSDGTDADIHGTLNYEILLSSADSQKARFAAAVDEAGNIFVTMVYDGEKLLDVTAPGKMMFTAMTNLSGDNRFKSPDYTIRNNSDLSKVKVSLDYEATVSGTLALAKQETAGSEDELALYIKSPRGTYSSNPFETELESQTKGERQFGLLTGASGDVKSSTLLGILNQKPVDTAVDPETAGSAGRFTFEADLFPYQKNGILTKSTLRGTYQARFRFEVTMPDETDAVRSAKNVAKQGDL